MKASELITVRLSLELSQSQMARALRVPLKTYQGWEQGRPIPEVAATAISADFLKRVKDVRKGKDI
jgi:DNA-binding transcriptional regulator YiaG